MDLLKGLTTRLKYLKETLMATLVSLILEIEFYLMSKLFARTTKKGIKQSDAA